MPSLLPPESCCRHQAVLIILLIVMRHISTNRCYRSRRESKQYEAMNCHNEVSFGNIQANMERYVGLVRIPSASPNQILDGLLDRDKNGFSYTGVT